MAAPKNNKNARKHGLRRMKRLAQAGYRDRQYPKEHKYNADETSVYATALHREAEEHHGQPVPRSVIERIQAMSAWHFYQLAVLKTLRDDSKRETPQFDTEAKLRWWAEYAKAADRKADHAKDLGLPTSHSSGVRFDPREFEGLTLDSVPSPSDANSAAGVDASGDENDDRVHESTDGQNATDAATEPQEEAT